MNEDLELFEVEISYIIPVLARDEQEAEEIAGRMERGGHIEEESECRCLSKMRSLPVYYRGCIPYSNDGENENDLTMDEIFAILEKKRMEIKRQKEIDAQQLKLNL